MGLTLEQDVTGDWILQTDFVEGLVNEFMGSARVATRAEAIDAFEANWPARRDEFDAMRAEDPEWLAGDAPEVARAMRRASSSRVSRGPGSGQRFRQLIIGGASNDEALRIIKLEFPEGKSSLADAAWNRYQLRRYPDKYDAVTGARR